MIDTKQAYFTYNKNELPYWPLFRTMRSTLIVFAYYLGVNISVAEHFSLLLTIFNSTLIPIFVFIEAVQARGMKIEEWKHHIIPPIVTYITFQTLNSLPAILSGTLTWKSYLLFSQNAICFFLAIPIWQAFFYLVPNKVLNQTKSRIVILIVSLFIGFIASEFLLVYSTFYEILVYLPYFALGYFVSDRQILFVRKANHFYIIMLVGITVLTVDQFNFISNALSEINILKPLGWIGFHFFTYLFFYWVSFIFGILSFHSVPSATRFVKLSAEPAGIYLLHPMICLLFLQILAMLHLQLSLLLVILLTIITVFICIYLSRIKVVKWFVTPTLYRRKIDTIED